MDSKIDLSSGTVGDVSGYECWRCGMWIYGSNAHVCNQQQQYYQITPDYNLVLGRIADALESIAAELLKRPDQEREAERER